MVFRALASLVVLLVIAPFAFAIACSPKTSDAPPPPATATASVAPPSSSSAPLVVESAPSPPTMSSAPPDPSPPEHDFVAGPCSERNAADRFIQTHRKCSSDSDCDVMSPPCGCAVGIQKTARPTAQVRSEGAYRACMKRNIPMPCATCPPAPAPACVDGTCRP